MSLKVHFESDVFYLMATDYNFLLDETASRLKEAIETDHAQIKGMLDSKKLAASLATPRARYAATALIAPYEQLNIELKEIFHYANERAKINLEKIVYKQREGEVITEGIFNENYKLVQGEIQSAVEKKVKAVNQCFKQIKKKKLENRNKVLNPELRRRFEDAGHLFDIIQSEYEKLRTCLFQDNLLHDPAISLFWNKNPVLVTFQEMKTIDFPLVHNAVYRGYKDLQMKKPIPEVQEGVLKRINERALQALGKYKVLLLKATEKDRERLTELQQGIRFSRGVSDIFGLGVLREVSRFRYSCLIIIAEKEKERLNKDKKFLKRSLKTALNDLPEITDESSPSEMNDHDSEKIKQMIEIWETLFSGEKVPSPKRSPRPSLVVRTSHRPIHRAPESNTNNIALYGLINIGNTCYLNVSLQLIAHVNTFDEFINADKAGEALEVKNLRQNLREIISQMREGTIQISQLQLSSLVDHLSKCGWRDALGVHADAQELLKFLRDKLSVAPSIKRAGKYASANAEAATIKMETHDIIISTPQGEMNELIRRYPTFAEDVNWPSCEAYFFIGTPPPFFYIQVSPYDHSHTIINPSLESFFNIEVPFSTSESVLDRDPIICKYRLKVAITHYSNGGKGGHYKAYVSQTNESNQKWVLYDDSDAAIFHSNEEVRKEISSHSAYLAYEVTPPV